MILVDARLDYRIHWTSLFTEAAEDALEQIDIVARSPPCIVCSLFRIDSDGQRRAHGLAKFAGDTSLFTIGITSQRMQTSEPRGLGRFLFRVLNSDVA